MHPLGIPVRAGSLFAYAVSASVILAVVLMPIVGAAADRSGRKKPLLAAAAYTGAAATAGMFFLDGHRYLLGAVLLIVANASLSVSMVLYNAYLPQIAGPEERDRVSSRGWAFGYTSGAGVLVLNLILYSGHDSFGVSESTAVRICLASAGIWWGAFTLVPAAGGCATARWRWRRPTGQVGAGWRQLVSTLRDMRARPLTLAFLLAYLIYNDGVQTVISQASIYGSEELGPRSEHAHRGRAAGAGPGGGGRARDGPPRPDVRREADDSGLARRLGGDPWGRLLPAGPRPVLFFVLAGGDRHGARRQPGAVHGRSSHTWCRAARRPSTSRPTR